MESGGTAGIPGMAEAIPFTGGGRCARRPAAPSPFDREFWRMVQETLALKADRVSSFTAGNLAALSSNGNLADSGRKPSDFQLALTFDDAPTQGSMNPVTSGGIWEAVKDATPEGFEEFKERVASLESLVPTAASAGNQLADKKHVADNFKPLQQAKGSPSAAGYTAAFIATVQQDKNGVITATKANVREASTSLSGIVMLSNSTNSSADNQAATPRAVSQAIQDLHQTVKQRFAPLVKHNWQAHPDSIVFDGPYFIGAEVEYKGIAPSGFWQWDGHTEPDPEYPGDPIYYWRLYLGQQGDLEVDGSVSWVWELYLKEGEYPGPGADFSDADMYVAYVDHPFEPFGDLVFRKMVGDGSFHAEILDPTGGIVGGDDLVAFSSDLSGYVPTTRTVNNKPLTGNVTLTGADIAVSGSDATKINTALGSKLGRSGAQTIGGASGSLTVRNAKNSDYSDAIVTITEGSVRVEPSHEYLLGPLVDSPYTTLKHGAIEKRDRYSDQEYTLTIPSATGTLALTSDIPAVPEVPVKAVEVNGTALEPDANGAVNIIVPAVPPVVAPSTSAADSGKAADAKLTGDALAALAATVPNDVSRNAERAMFYHVGNGASTSLGWDIKLVNKDSNLAGLMSPGDKTKLDALPDGATLAASYKPKQIAVTPPAASGNEVQFIDTVEQNEDGVIFATKKGIRAATLAQAGIVQLENAVNYNVTTRAATPSAVKQAYDKALAVEAEIPYVLDPLNTLRATNRSVRKMTVSAATDSLDVMPAVVSSHVRDFIVDVENAYPGEATVEFNGLGGTWLAWVPEGEDLSEMTTLAEGEKARFYFSETGFVQDGISVFLVVKQVVGSSAPAQGAWSINADGTVSTEGELNADGTLTVEGTVNADGTLTVDAI